MPLSAVIDLKRRQNHGRPICRSIASNAAFTDAVWLFVDASSGGIRYSGMSRRLLARFTPQSFEQEIPLRYARDIPRRNITVERLLEDPRRTWLPCGLKVLDDRVGAVVTVSNQVGHVRLEHPILAQS